MACLLTPTEPNLRKVAAALRERAICVVPTETVYGLACHALDEFAIERVYAAKARPETNPLIVHVSGLSMAQGLIAASDDRWQMLAEAFWPGPLSIVLPKNSRVPDLATAGRPSVALRMPRHPVFLGLIRLAGVPLAAPSANRFTELSPTRIEDVSPELLGGVDFALDGGPCPVGIESTVVSLLEPEAVVLRPGAFSTEQIAKVLGQSVRAHGGGATQLSPGEHPRHYAPRSARVVLVDHLGSQPGLGFAVPLNGHQRQMPRDPAGFAAELYAALAEWDRLGLEVIAVERPPDTPEWAAVLDRLNRASHPG